MLRKLPIYFSHGYRERETVYNKYFGILIEQNGFIPSLDPPSEDVNSAKLEKHLRHTTGLIAIVADRGGNMSPYIRYEIDMAIRCGKPVLVFIEDNLPDKILPDFILKRRFSTKSFFRDYYEHNSAIQIFKTFIGEYQLPKYQSLTFQKSAILLGFDAKNIELEDVMKKHLNTNGYNVWDNLEKDSQDLVMEGQKHFYLSNVYLAICLLDDINKKGSYYLGAIRSIQIPTILLTQSEPKNFKDWIPNEFKERKIPKDNNEDSLEIISSQIELYEEDFVIVDNEKKWENYVNSMTIGPIKKGEYTNELRNTIINKIHMGDKFENISGNVVKDNKGNIVQSQGDVNIEGSFIQERFGENVYDALANVAEIINQSNNQDAKELFDSMQTELKKEEPKKSIVSTLWSGITSVLPVIKSSIDIYAKVSEMINGLI